MNFESAYEFDSLHRAYLLARREKRYRPEVLSFTRNLEENLIEIQNELMWRTYQPGPYRSFTIHEKKTRRIYALPFRDRVVQHALYAAVYPVLDAKMIGDSYACRVSKGTHQAVRRVSYFLGKPSNKWYLKCDISSYFPSVDIRLLIEIFNRYIKDEGLRWLYRVVICHTDRGLPIGNIMSQISANLYLNELDHYLKTVCGVKYYLRYMDDFVVFGASRRDLQQILHEATSYIENVLHLRMNPKTKIGRVNEGLEFVGYRVWPNNKLIKKDSQKRMLAKRRAWRKGKMSDERFLLSLGSWCGHAKGTASHGFVEKMLLDTCWDLSKRHAETQNNTLMHGKLVT